MSDLDDQNKDVRSKRGRRESGGPSLFIGDPVGRLFKWFMAAIGSLAMIGSLTAAKNLYDLNLTVAEGVTHDNAIDQRVSDHEQRLRQVERDVNTIEGKVLRGQVDDLGLVPDGPRKEPERGH